MKKTFLALTCLAALHSMGGCSNPPSSASTPATPAPAPAPKPVAAIDEAYQGIWIAPAYGTVLTVSDIHVDYLKYTSDYCFIEAQFDDVTTHDIERQLRSNDSDGLTWFAGYGTRSFGAPGMQLVKAESLPAACDTKLSASTTLNDATTLFAMFSQIMGEYYVDFARTGTDWPQVIYDAGLNLQASSGENAIMDAVLEAITPLADVHTSLESPSGQVVRVSNKPLLFEKLVREYAKGNDLPFPIPPNRVTPALINAINTYIDSQLNRAENIVTSYASSPDSIRQDKSGQLTWFVVENTGYLRIDSMTDYADNLIDADDLARVKSALENLDMAMDEVLNDLGMTDNLIVDIRNNGGGNDYISLALAGRFTDTPIYAYQKQAREGSGRTAPVEVIIEPHGSTHYTRPVILLTSHSTVSAAETFALAMQAFDHVTLIGEPTQGAFSDVLSWTLPGGYTLNMSNEFYLTAQGEWLEGQGVPVDYAVPFFTQEERKAGRDAGIERALTLLNTP